MYHTYLGKFRKGARHVVMSIDVGVKNLAVRMETRTDLKVDTHLFEKICLNTVPKMNSTTYSNLIKYMETRKDFFQCCDLFLIEGQHWQNRAANIIFHVMVTWITCRRLGNICILQINPKLKSRIIGPYKGSALKTQAVVKCYEILRKRQDRSSLYVLDSHKKRDDLADTCLQIEAFFAMDHPS